MRNSINSFMTLPKKDALHVACAIEGHCEYFLTTDDKLLKKRQTITSIQVISPVDFVTDVLEAIE